MPCVSSSILIYSVYACHATARLSHQRHCCVANGKQDPHIATTRPIDYTTQLAPAPAAAAAISVSLRTKSTAFRNCSKNTNIQIVLGVSRTIGTSNHPLNKNLGPSLFKLSPSRAKGPAPPGAAFITRDLTTSAGAQMVVATVPAAADERKCSGRPLVMEVWARRASLKKSYETS